MELLSRLFLRPRGVRSCILCLTSEPKNSAYFWQLKSSTGSDAQCGKYFVDNSLKCIMAAVICAGLGLKKTMFSTFDRLVFKAAWRNRAKISRRPKIAVVGNCHSQGIAYAMAMAVPEFHVESFCIELGSKVSVHMLARVLSDYDFVFMNEIQEGYIRGGGSTALISLLPRARLLPSIAFSAYHPDLIYINISNQGGAPITSPTGYYHSAIAYYAFRRGYTPIETASLFCAKTYSELGYFDTWGSAQKAFEDECKKFGFDLGQEFLNWTRRGIFMYSVNHPKAFVLLDVARKALQSVGVCTRPELTEHFLVDRLSSAEVFPVYPEIAAHYSDVGEMIFRCRRFNLEKGEVRFLNLDTYINECFKHYGSFKGCKLVSQRIDRWLADTSFGHAMDLLVTNM